jgi:hypothetical protein
MPAQNWATDGSSVEVVQSQGSLMITPNEVLDNEMDPWDTGSYIRWKLQRRVHNTCLMQQQRINYWEFGAKGNANDTLAIRQRHF